MKHKNTQQRDEASPVVSLVSLGCAKNEVDSERILGSLLTNGFLFAEDPAESDICLVNTCGFIHDAREESAEVLAELSALKESGRLRFVVALGCLVERVADYPDYASFLADADAMVGFKDFTELPRVCQELLSSSAPSTPDAARGALDTAFRTLPRLRIGSSHTAYLKISEGCSNGCRFCSIPRIRGSQVSRPQADIIAEAVQLVETGAAEIDLIAQDTSSYGKDLYGERRLPQLLRALSDVEFDGWIRLMYAYPRHLNQEMLDALGSDDRFCRYLDLPLQHISDSMLKAMGRGMGKDETLALLERVRATLPDVAIRTTFIVGYPGETEEDVQELLTFIREFGFHHVGAFMYSPEALTPAAKLDETVSETEKAARRDALMAAQLDVSRELMSDMAGREIDVMVDGFLGEETEELEGITALAHARFQAPEVDGVVLLAGDLPENSMPGTVLRATVTTGMDYDLIAEVREQTAAS